MSSSPRSPQMAIAVFSATALAIGSMYYAGQQAKSDEGKSSVYHDDKRPIEDSDSKMGSSGVREAMHKTKGT